MLFRSRAKQPNKQTRNQSKRATSQEAALFYRLSVLKKVDVVGVFLVLPLFVLSQVVEKVPEEDKGTGEEDGTLEPVKALGPYDALFLSNFQGNHCYKVCRMVFGSILFGFQHKVILHLRD